ncbi:lysophospholipid acyltransferase family protein [Aestuariicella hydrocarbonica]|uniref:L-ornithine N(alpha)-acyltransferase n=1 Tax=Pseudomaricurvus hydrocarbonicus TaxID=1470433 RepID=A0A9E5JWQ8_9GAMM|nr:GNAT family N-acyltransferase [Aestuariicella hydrocarbonica]NHO66988.1 lysophospholipid acyltransferase family protein [Aestuariicella hydrocarbonica]
MINIEQTLCEKYPGFGQQQEVIKRSTFSLLRKLTHEQEINLFLHEHAGLDPIAFIDSVFDYFNFSYSVSSRDKANIPDQGRVVIIANHPIGSLDGLAILRMVSEVRQDVKIIANDMLMNFEALHPLLIPLDNLTGGGAIKSFRRALEELQQERAVIIFPAGEVSRVRPHGVRDSRWRPGCLKMARRAKAPVLPIHIRAKNSLLFYSASMLYKPLGTALLAKEMFNKKSATINFCVGEPIPCCALHTDHLSDKALLRRLKKHLYKLGRRKHKRSMFITEKTIAHPEDRLRLVQESRQMRTLGETRDGNCILLTGYGDSPVTMREVGRLREYTFRKVGEGTGAKRDLDNFDRSYQHLLLWDREAMCLAGAYRLGNIKRLLKEVGSNGLYTHTLFDFQPAFYPYLQQGLELGRSFVNPQYWGKNSLDYLWQGIGAYLNHHDDVRYMMGPVTVSARFNKPLIDLLVFYYQRYYTCPQALASAKQPYFIEPERRCEMEALYLGLDREEGFALLQKAFQLEGEKVPVLFKQYASLFEEGGFQLLAFSVDPDFSDCIDGLFLADLSKLKVAKRKRYLGDGDRKI